MGRMNGTFRLRLPKLFLLSYLTTAFLFLATSLFDSPKLHLWGIFCLNLFVPISHLNFLLLELFLCNHSGIVQCFAFLGFLTLLANFGLVALIPVGIRVLGVETPLRT